MRNRRVPGRRVIGRLVASIGLAVAAAAHGQGRPQNLPAITLNAGMHNIRAQVAQTPEQRQVGLMFRREMPAHEGMLFVFEAPGEQCFWMRNTLLPLSIAFLKDDGTIVNVDEMEPMTESSHCSAQAVRYVLEMNKGWFSKRGLKAGSKLAGLPAPR